jgi:hypothetical protein
VRTVAAIPRPARIALLVAVVAVAAAGAWLLAQARDDGEGAGAAGLQPFYLEATVETDPGPEVPEDEPREGVIRMWFRAGDRWRYEIEFTEPSGAASRSQFWVADGQMFFYEGESNTYRVTPFTPTPDGYPYPISLALFLGPFPGVSTVDELVDRLRSISQAPDAWAEVRGISMVAGRRVVVIRTGPAWSSVRSTGGGPDVRESGGEVELLVDSETLFVLASSADRDDVGGYRVETRVIRYNARIDDADLRFELPRDAQRVD